MSFFSERSSFGWVFPAPFPSTTFSAFPGWRHPPWHVLAPVRLLQTAFLGKPTPMLLISFFPSSV